MGASNLHNLIWFLRSTQCFPCANLGYCLGLVHTYDIKTRTVMLPSQTAQKQTEYQVAQEDWNRPDEEKQDARVLWDLSLLQEGAFFPDGMALCVAAASEADFLAFLAQDPYLREGDVFDKVTTYRWTQVLFYFLRSYHHHHHQVCCALHDGRCGSPRLKLQPNTLKSEPSPLLTSIAFKSSLSL